MPENKTTGEGSKGPSLDDLINLYKAQKMAAEMTIDALTQAKEDAEELQLYRERETRRLILQNPEMTGEIK